MVIRLLRVNILTYTAHTNIVIRSIENDTTFIKYHVTHGEKLYFGGNIERIAVFVLIQIILVDFIIIHCMI